MNADLDKLVVFAQNRAEMVESQQALVNWADFKVAEAEKELQEAVENLEHAKKHKWKTSGWATVKARATKTLDFYVKIQQALLAGYAIVPNFPIDVFAVRTKRKFPLERYEEATSKDGWTPRSLTITNRDVRNESLPLGVGEYVDRVPTILTTRKQLTDGTYRHAQQTTEFNSVDFPIKAVKPVILEETGKALMLKIFDEIGCSPSPRMAWNTRVPSTGDPMVVGRVNYQYGNKTKTISFLLAWWLDVKDLIV